MNQRVVVVLIGAGFAIWGFVASNSVKSEFDDNESITSGAPQQQVAASWAMKDAALVGLQMLGVLGGLVIVSLAILADKGSAEEESERIANRTAQRCDACWEVVPAEATICRACRSGLPGPPPSNEGETLPT